MSMSMFNPYWKCNYDELITFYPRYYRDVLEMDAILHAEGKLADGIQNGIDLMLLNNFIESADDDTITKLEEFLGLSLMKQRTLDEKRRFIKSVIAGQGKVSASRISEMIRAYTGADTECEFYPFDEEKNNRLDVRFERGSESVIYASDIYTLLAKMLPAHIEYRAEMTYRFPIGVAKRRYHYPYLYDLCGTKPYSILIAQIQGVEAVTEANADTAVMDYRQSSSGGTEPPAGVYPDVSTLAHYDAINAATEAVSSDCGVDYIPCGTIYSGQGG